MDLTIENLIKIIIGIAVFVVVILGVYLFFKNHVIDFFNNQVPDKPIGLFLELIK